MSEIVLETKTTLRLPDEILTELKHIAIDDKRTLTEIVVEALRDYLKKRGKKL
jgi:predicted transcriptional regulator